MSHREFYIDFFDKEYLDFNFPNGKNSPQFQLAKDFGGSYHVISKPKNFPTLALNILAHLKKDVLCHNHDIYQFELSKKASEKITETEKRVLEEILLLHNDFVRPKRNKSYSKRS